MKGSPITLSVATLAAILVGGTVASADMPARNFYWAKVDAIVKLADVFPAAEVATFKTQAENAAIKGGQPKAGLGPSYKSVEEGPFFGALQSLIKPHVGKGEISKVEGFLKAVSDGPWIHGRLLARNGGDFVTILSLVAGSDGKWVFRRLDKAVNPGSWKGTTFDSSLGIEVKRRHAAIAAFPVIEASGDARRDHQKTIAAMTEFLRRYGDDASDEVSPLVLDAYHRIARAQEGLGRAKDAAVTFARVVAEGKSRGIKPGALAATFVADAEFRILEPQFQAFVAFKFVASDDAKTMQQRLKELTDKAVALKRAYEPVIAWNRPYWVTAAGFRTGEVFHLCARKLLEAPPPPRIKKLDGESPGSGILNQYREIIRQHAQPAAKAAQESWVKVLGYAAKAPISNEWTRQSQSRLHGYQPERYPAPGDK
ncbi:MAG: hypothetical protein HY906_05850 [Deltaproteobacteria bacterium]|nr:hypothetical protein [Deltaproteobacteria bacterium]